MYKVTRVLKKKCRVKIALGLIIAVYGPGRAWLGQNVHGLVPGRVGFSGPDLSSIKHPNTVAFEFPTLLELPQQIKSSDGGDLSQKKSSGGEITFGRAHLAA